jgi:glucans biosynthesis protein C
MNDPRFHSLDAVRACALLAGIVLHATMAYLPGFDAMRWPIADKSTSEALGLTFFVIHIFRMSLFFMMAGFFARLLRERLGTAGLVRNRLRRIGLPFLAAMVLVMPLTLLPIIWSTLQTGIKGGPPPGTLPPVLGPGVPLGHLWFLYLLLLLLALWLPVRSLLVRLDSTGSRRAAWGGAVAGLVVSRFAPVMLAVPVSLLLAFTPWWRIWQGIPVPAVGLIPNLPALITFGGAFLLGWCLHREPSTLRSMAADWLLYLVAAVLATVACMLIAGDTLHFGLQPLPQFERMAFAGGYALALWCWCFAAIGAAARLLDRPAPRWRYLADASYWMYLVHLPIVWLLQAATLRWPFPWAVKFPMVLLVTMTLLFASYHWLVRDTFVGVFLNGRRHPRPRLDGIAITSTPRTSPG